MAAPDVSEPAGARLLDGAGVAAAICAEVGERVSAHLAEGGPQPRLAVLLVSDDPADLVYAQHKERACADAGMAAEIATLPASASQDDVLERAASLNGDPAVSGILVQLPLPPQIDTLEVISAVAPRKDVDGLSPSNLGLLLQGRPLHRPATAAGALELLRREGIPLDGRRVVIIGRSLLVARPLALLLATELAASRVSVTVTDLDAPDVEATAREADVLVAAVDRPHAVGPDLVRPGATVVDAGLHWIEDATRESGRRLVGDVDLAAVRPVAGAISPVPGGLGPMTIPMLLQNTLEAAMLAS